MTGPPERERGPEGPDSDTHFAAAKQLDRKDTRTVEQVAAEATQRRAADEHRRQINREWAIWTERQKILGTRQHLCSWERWES